MSSAMDLVWQTGKAIGIATVFVVSLPVLAPCVVIVTLTGAALAVPVGSAAAGYVLVKKLCGLQRRLFYGPEQQASVEWYDENKQQDYATEENVTERMEDKHEDELSEGGIHALSGFAAEETPEKGVEGRVSDDFIVVEKPSQDAPAAGSEADQCKAPPELFEAEDRVQGDEEAAKDREKASEDYVSVSQDIAPQQEQHTDNKTEDGIKSDEQGVVLEDSGRNDSVGSTEQEIPSKSQEKEEIKETAAVDEGQALKNNAEVAKGLNDNGSAAVAQERPRSSVDEFRSSTGKDSHEETISSSDESVASSRSSTAASKPAISEKERRHRLRKEIALVKKIVGCTDTLVGSLGEQVEKLYDFVGMELPAGYERTSDYTKLMEALNLLKAVVGVK